ncbi:MAG: pilus assembly protein [Chloroflexi bacterium]|nr:pilus assembly protein [Chloroflexota bacterium]
MKRRFLVAPAGQRGQALVEFGLVALIFVVTVVNLLDVMRGFWYLNTLAFAVQEGARYAIVRGAQAASPVGPADPSAVVAVVQARCVGLDPASLTVVVLWPDGDNQSGSRVRVQASYSYDPILLDWMTLDLSRQSEMVIQ